MISQSQLNFEVKLMLNFLLIITKQNFKLQAFRFSQYSSVQKRIPSSRLQQAIVKEMFMKRQLIEGNLFKLGKNKNDEQLQFSENNFNSVATNQSEEDTGSFETTQRKRKSPGMDSFDVEQIAAQNSMAVVLCGAMICCFCAIIGFAVFYFFVLDHIKPYIPFLYSSNYFLTESNAKQYFAQNPLYAGEFHYPRIPVQYWRHRIEMVKSMGLNALSVYVFWNYHEISKGKFDFQTRNKNLTYFLELCKQYDMRVLIRPGPYVCAEWDFGGLPTRFLSVQGLEIRSSNQLFLDETRIYFQEVGKVIKKYVRNRNNPSGPILMLQVENEPSWFTNEKLYIDKLKQIWDDIKIGCPLYFDDTERGLRNDKIYWDKAIIGMNSQLYTGNNYDIFDNTDHFVFGGEVYSGWFSTWGGFQSWEGPYLQKILGNFTSQYQKLLSKDKSFSMYMAHGGTNFGLTAGFNFITSYDYSAPVSQQGLPNIYYHAFRSLMLNHGNEVPSKIPSPIPTMQVQFGSPVPISSFYDNLPSAIKSNIPIPFESEQLQMFNQGIVMYETNIKGPKIYKIETIVHDISLFIVDGQLQQTLIRITKQKILESQKKEILIQCKKQSCLLQVLVQAMGHINFGLQMKLDKKGLLYIAEKQTDYFLKKQWKHYKLDVTDIPSWKNISKCEKAPCLYSIEKNLQETKDTYINLKGLKKGYVWVNGHSLGRYWDIGPQHSLYCPGVWLKKGQNKIIILDLFENIATLSIKGDHQLS